VTKYLTKLATRKLVLLLLAAGIAGCNSGGQASLEEENNSSSDAEVIVTIAVPEGETLAGTAIITLEDITMQDAPAVQLASVSAEASSLTHSLPTITIPIDLSLVNAGADINVAVHIDSDNDGRLSNGDWISDTIVNVINNGKMAVVVEIIKI